MSEFRFKKFSVQHHLAAMKVGTDAVLLGSWTDIPKNAVALDIGTGSGLIALMLAQRNCPKIIAIDIHEGSIVNARDNFRNSPWNAKLKAQQINFQEFWKTAPNTFDLIVSNPPFFQNDLPSSSRNTEARHASSLNFDELIEGCMHLLTHEGLFSLILPSTEAGIFTQKSEKKGLYLIKRMRIQPKRSKNENRQTLCFSKSKKILQEENLCIREEDNTYTDDYKTRTASFYLNF